MDTEFELLKREFSLSPSEISKISERIIKNNTFDIIPSKNPHAVILGGQPGSGKGELTTKAQELLGTNSIICNADDYRDQHPQIKRIKSDYPTRYADITAEYAQKWNNLLREHCENNRFNYVLETTFSSGKRMNETIRDMTARGYKVSIMLLSVHHNLSFLGTRLRYEGMLASTGFGRAVSKVQHDERYDAIIDTLKGVLGAKLYNDIYIFARASKQRLKGTTYGLRQLSKNGENPLEDYLQERYKHWSENDLRFFTSDILQVVKQMIWRKASNEELKEIFNVFDLENVEQLLAPETDNGK